MKRLAAAALAALAAPALAGDVIVLADGRTLGAPKAADPPGAADFAASNLTVSEENTDSVLYRLAGVQTRQSLPRTQVRAVAHDPATVPPDLTEGLALLAKSRFDEGRAKLVTVARNAAAPIWAQAEAGFRHAESYATEGNPTGAERALAVFAKERTRSRYVLDARRLRARLLADLGRDEEVKSEYDQIAKIAGVTDEEALGARFLSAWTDARSALRSGEAERKAAAAKAFDEIRARSAKAAAVAARCDAAKAALRGAGDVGPLVASSEDPFVLAVGNTLLADAARERGREKKDRALLEEAEERYLKVVLLYRDAEGVSDFAAAAQFHAGTLLVELAPDDADAKARARREWDDLVRRSPRSEWAKRAKAALAELQ